MIDRDLEQSIEPEDESIRVQPERGLDEFSRFASKDWIRVTLGSPWVSVPVLSNATTSTSGSASSVSMSLIRIPLVAISPVPAPGPLELPDQAHRGKRLLKH